MSTKMDPGVRCVNFVNHGDQQKLNNEGRFYKTINVYGIVSEGCRNVNF